MTIDPKDLGELQKALNDAASKASILWTSFIIFQLYLVITFGSVTHRDLFLENSINLPVLNVNLPLIGFFVVAPTILIIFHFYVFLQLFAMAKKTKRYDILLEQEVKASDRGDMRERLDSFVVLQFLAGPAEQMTGLIGFSLRFIGWATLVAAPAIILLQGQVTFLPYHLARAAWLQRVAVLLDLVLIWYFWNRIRGVDELIFARQLKSGWTIVGGLASLFIFLFSWTLATFPGERVHDNLPTIRLIPATWRPRWSAQKDWTSLHELLFAGTPDEVTARPNGLFSNRLILSDESFVDPTKLDKAEVSHSFRGRDLNYAVLTRADLRQADFTGAKLNQALLNGAKLQNTHLGCANTDSGCAELQGADLRFAQLQGARLTGADLQNAYLRGAQLQGANLMTTRLQGVDLRESGLQGTNLVFAYLQGADLTRAQLQGADLANAQLQGADLFEAQSQGADFAGGQLQGANLTGAQLQGANLTGAQLQGADLTASRTWRVSAMPIPNIDLTDLGRCDRDGKPWDDRGTGVHGFSEWIDSILQQIPPNSSRDTVEERLSVLDPRGSEPPHAIGEELCRGEFSKSAEWEERLAALLADLACSKLAPPYVARGLLNSRMAATGTRVTGIVERLRKSRSDPNACRGADGLTDKDWRRVDELNIRASIQ
jgi:uncharacterized protein YjbI with pentapeptide repeats